MKLSFLIISLCLSVSVCFGQSRVNNASNYGAWSSNVYAGNASTAANPVTVNIQARLDTKASLTQDTVAKLKINLMPRSSYRSALAEYIVD
jgi:hypothetical protein